MMLLRSIVSLWTQTAAAEALVSLAPASKVSVSPIYQGLESTPLTRASDEALVNLTDLWKSKSPFGLGDQFAVCAFLRHYG